jgi:hypothetical protein
VKKIELMARRPNDVMRRPPVVDDRTPSAVEDLEHNVLTSTRRDPIDDRLRVREHPQPAVLPTDSELRLVGVDHSLLGDLGFQ